MKKECRNNMTDIIPGGYSSYGHIAGILMSDSVIPRIPGDPGHAGTFDFPVIYETLKGFPFEALISARKEHLEILLSRAKKLQDKGARFIAADCGLFGPYQSDLIRHLDVPFIGSALDLVPLLKRHLPVTKKVGILTGDLQILKSVHLEASGIDPDAVRIIGMQNTDEFKRVVIERADTLDMSAMRAGVIETAGQFDPDDIGAVVLECTNLISFRRDIQMAIKKPVYDLVTLIEFYASGFLKRTFDFGYM